MKNFLKIILCIAVIGTAPIGCGSDDENLIEEENAVDEEIIEEPAQITVTIVDAPGDYKHVNVEVLGLEVVVDEEIISLELIWKGADQPSPEILDLLEYTGGGYDYLVFEHDIPAGDLTQIKLILGENNEVVMADDSVFPLQTPKDQQGGLEVSINHALEAGEIGKYILDFDVEASIVEISDPEQSFDLVPVIRVSNYQTTGHIYGYLAEELESSPAHISVTTDAITFTTQTWFGEFMLWGLPEGNHDMTIHFGENSEHPDIVVENVPVEVEKTTSIGSINH